VAAHHCGGFSCGYFGKKLEFIRRAVEREVKLLLIEPRGVLNTGHQGGERTAENDVWI
jgi:hypothetical protein